MKAAIIGPPFSGKSTLFSAVTSLKPSPADLPAPRHAVVSVPDPRLDFLVGLYRPKKVIHATIEFVDIPGFSLADARGRDEFRRHLPTIRNCELLVLVVRDFHSQAVPAYREQVNAASDVAEIHDELIFADLETVGKRMEKLQKALTKPTKTHEAEKKELALLASCHEALEGGKPLSAAISTAEDAAMVSSFAFLTERPAVVVYNVDDDRAGEHEVATPEHFHSAVALCAEIEAQINDLDPEDRPAFLADLGITVPARDKLINTCYEAMDFISFLTTGPEAVRAWPIKRGTVAVDAAGKIHSDLARGFIRAETVAYEDLVEAGDFKTAKAAGKVRQEGKTYVVQDGDILNIKFNV